MPSRPGAAKSPPAQKASEPSSPSSVKATLVAAVLELVGWALTIIGGMFALYILLSNDGSLSSQMMRTVPPAMRATAALPGAAIAVCGLLIVGFAELIRISADTALRVARMQQLLGDRRTP